MIQKGKMDVYDCGQVKLHAYKTNDYLENEVFILQKADNAVVIESPCFFDNRKELEQYLSDMHVVGVLLSYHMGGGTFLQNTRKFATENASQYGHFGGGAALIQNFSQTFGDVFDSSIHTITDYLEAGEVTLGDIRFHILPTQEAYDIEIPEINAVYTHMLGHDCHSIVAGAAQADLILAQLYGYLDKGYDLILTSHYTPEGLKDVRTKIAYIEDLKKIAASCAGAAAFRSAVQQRYPDYSGGNYLEMTASFFYGND